MVEFFNITTMKEDLKYWWKYKGKVWTTLTFRSDKQVWAVYWSNWFKIWPEGDTGDDWLLGSVTTASPTSEVLGVVVISVFKLVWEICMNFFDSPLIQERQWMNFRSDWDQVELMTSIDLMTA